MLATTMGEQETGLGGQILVVDDPHEDSDRIAGSDSSIPTAPGCQKRTLGEEVRLRINGAYGEVRYQLEECLIASPKIIVGARPIREEKAS
jgi:hypothetical protein